MAPRVALDHPWLTLELEQPMQVLSWAINRPGFVFTRRIVWREVCNADLPEELNVREWLCQDLAERGEAESVAFLTSRNLNQFQTANAHANEASAFAIATVGLSNAERVGSRQGTAAQKYGTINIAALLNTALSQTGLIEAQSIVVQARTAAVLDADIRLETGRATGTGTDCVAVAAPVGTTDYAGLHTDVGEALGRAVYDAVHAGAMEWKDEQDVVADA
ncbi:MAG: adenosylcobinamide amidohydrolase [Pseudomonadota bacterium]